MNLKKIELIALYKYCKKKLIEIRENKSCSSYILTYRGDSLNKNEKGKLQMYYTDCYTQEKIIWDTIIHLEKDLIDHNIDVNNIDANND